jgi:hypothetical protein
MGRPAYIAPRLRELTAGEPGFSDEIDIPPMFASTSPSIDRAAR